MNRTRIQQYSPWLLMLGLIAICAAVYAPGLRGSFVFDDSTFILANTAMHVTGLRFGDWISAALSFPGGSHQGRWLGMLSFAINHYFTGLDPFWLKLTNLAIHLLNGVLVFLMIRALLLLWRECGPLVPARRHLDIGFTAAALAGLWLVMPINLTAVLYVSQRLESLSTTFILLGLWLYIRARRAYWEERGGMFGLWWSLLLGTGIGVLVKESAVMLPMYAAIVEFSITRFRSRNGQWNRPVLCLYAVTIGMPLVLGSIWLLSWVGGASSYARPFTLCERLMTEARVILDYIQWALIPQPESLTLYHDDIAISRGLMTPPTTAASIIGIAALLGVALWQRTRRPLMTLGVLWFLGGHLLTGTVIPLMLAFEHRNYFPSIGLLLAAASPILLEGGVARFRVRAFLVGCIFLFYAFTTWMRAEEWSDPLRLALSEASKRPSSSAAQYELGRVLLYSHKKDDSAPMIEQAFEVLERASHLPNSDILHEQLLIVGHAQLQRPADPAWWSSLIAKLRGRPPTTADIGGLIELLRCYQHGVCPGDMDNLRLAFEAAVSHPSADGVLLSAYGEFADKYLNDPTLAERQFRAALTRAPTDVTTNSNLIVFLIHHRRLDEARAELARLRGLNRFGSLDAKINELEKTLNAAAFETDSEGSAR